MTNLKIPFPKPITLTAMLINEHGNLTPHTFLETRECTVKVQVSESKFVEEPAFEFIFKCSETNTERRWGLADRVELDAETN